MIYNLDSFADRKNVGNKAFILMDLKRSNYNVPSGFVISSNTVASINRKGFSKGIKKKILSYAEELSYPLVVRSSSIFEDSRIKSYAGLFKSIVDVKNNNQLFNAIMDVAQSVKSNHVLEYHGKDMKKNSLAIIVQEQIKPLYSGVFFTKNPVGKGFLIEYVRGHLLRLVSGLENSYKIQNKSHLRRGFKELYKIGMQLEEYFNCPQDIEFAISKNNEVFILQSRPIKQLVKQYSSIKTKKHQIHIRGVPLSFGTTKGKIQFIYDDIKPEEAGKVFKKGSILATYVLFPEYYGVYKKAKAVICMVDSITSHPAIVSRELEIPCVGGVNITKLSKMLDDFDEITVDGNKGKISFIPKVQNIREEIKGGVTASRFPPNKEYLEHEEKIKKAVEKKDPFLLKELLERAIINMQSYFKKYLKNKNKKDINYAKGYFFNLCHFFQDKFVLILKNKGHAHKQIITAFEKVDKNKNWKNNKISKMYSIIKEYAQKIDSYATYGTKHIWDFN